MTAAFLFGDTAASCMMSPKINASPTRVSAYDDEEVTQCDVLIVERN